jgi:ABC-type transport system involved in multi-copper enzyme maturation permease subunit
MAGRGALSSVHLIVAAVLPVGFICLMLQPYVIDREDGHLSTLLTVPASRLRILFEKFAVVVVCAGGSAALAAWIITTANSNYSDFPSTILAAGLLIVLTGIAAAPLAGLLPRRGQVALFLLLGFIAMPWCIASWIHFVTGANVPFVTGQGLNRYGDWREVTYLSPSFALFCGAYAALLLQQGVQRFASMQVR